MPNADSPIWKPLSVAAKRVLPRRLYDTARDLAIALAANGAGAPAAKKINYAKNLVSARLGLGRCLGSPTLVTIEPINICDQKCPICETGVGKLDRPKETMSFDSFKKILAQFDDNLERMFFYFMGEPLLNRDAYRMIRHAADRGIRVSLCTNSNHVDPKQLVESGVAEVNFQISGMTQETHDIYRRGGDLKAAMSAIEETVRLRNESGRSAADMKIAAGFILFRHNERETDEFVKYCSAAGVDAHNIIGTCLREHSQGEHLLPSDRAYRLYNEEEFKKGNLVPKTRPDNYCPWIYFSTTILVNGDVVPCCRDQQGKHVMGNVFKDNFYNIWNNEKYRKLRKLVSAKSNSIPLCALCPGEGAPPL